MSTSAVCSLLSALRQVSNESLLGVTSGLGQAVSGITPNMASSVSGAVPQALPKVFAVERMVATLVNNLHSEFLICISAEKFKVILWSLKSVLRGYLVPAIHKCTKCPGGSTLIATLFFCSERFTVGLHIIFGLAQLKNPFYHYHISVQLFFNCLGFLIFLVLSDCMSSFLFRSSVVRCVNWKLFCILWNYNRNHSVACSGTVDISVQTLKQSSVSSQDKKDLKKWTSKHAKFYNFFLRKCLKF